MEGVDLLILGAGWTATFLIPLLQQHSDSLTFAATTTTGRPVCGVDTIPFRFDPESKDPGPIANLPRARYILITFPLTGEGQSKWLTETYEATHPRRGEKQKKYRFIQLGSTGVWQVDGRRKRHGDKGREAEREARAKAEAEEAAAAQQEQQQPPSTETKKPFHFTTRHSPYLTTDPRAIAEDELRFSSVVDGMVLSLSGLWGGSRDPRNWVSRVAYSKEAMRHKTSLHMIHGVDIARAVYKIITACEEDDKEGSEEKKWEEHGKGQRWMLTDGFVYDWWALLMGWATTEGQEDGEPSEQARWVMELMEEEGVQALPRSMELMGRAYDSREFWRTWGLVPVKARVGVNAP
ncbi:hypothetical protein B0H65DRAFT_460689 [Neurospora tetraspora]|uniref:NAD(P)-binding protein n=1 Tax=Neurospora tetraspora TaxID=94610 RepID=A0AAE0JHW7_9PEZI|nr:hypothetical protein B0H65DRAFT_460689 [Neurospora tetraspora]